MTYQIFNPLQLQEMGGLYYETPSFSMRYRLHKRLLFQNFYMAYGPICKTDTGMYDFINHVKSFKLTQVVFELPYIFDENIRKDTLNLILKNGFSKHTCIQDSETILLKKGDLQLDKKDRYYVRYGKRHCNFSIKQSYGENDLEQIYAVYIESAQRIGYIPRELSIFERLKENMLCSIAYNKNTNKIEGFVIGYISSIVPYEKVMHIVFAGTTETGREAKAGYSLYYDLFLEAFEKYDVEIIDMLGASRTQNRTYTVFKNKFGGEFVEYPGSFKKENLF